MRWTPLLPTALLLAGCYSPPPPQQYVRIPDRYEHLLANFGVPRFPQPYCYRTLGVPDCRPVPLYGEEGRLINDPDPSVPFPIVPR